jgi:hypothetical protein
MLDHSTKVVRFASPETTMRTTTSILLTLSFFFFTACFDSGDEGLQTCPDEGLPTSIEVGLGEIIEFTAPSETEISPTAVPSGWQHLSSQDNTLVMRAGYEEDVENLSLFLSCGSTLMEHSIEVSYRQAQWTELGPWTDEEGPAEREHTQIWIDPAHGDDLYLFGGYLFSPAQFTPAHDLWRFDLEEEIWAEVDQTGDVPETVGGRIALNTEPGTALYFGGSDEERHQVPTATQVDINEAQAVWTDLAEASEELIGVELGAFVYDAPRDRHLWTLGLWESPVGLALLLANQVQSFDASTGSLETIEVASGSQPEPRYGLAWALDSKNDRLVISVGGGAPTANDPVNPETDTWAFDLDQEQWSLIETSGVTPTGRRNGCHAYDSVNHRIFFWGGTADGFSAVPGIYILDLDEGQERWTKIDVPNGPDERASCSGVFDEVRQQVIFGFGNNSQARYADLWALQL